MAEYEEQVISAAESEPVIEYTEEVQPDGSILRKKKTTRKITKRILSSTSSTSVSTSVESHERRTSSSSVSVSTSAESQGRRTSSSSVSVSTSAESQERTTAASSTTIRTRDFSEDSQYRTAISSREIKEIETSGEAKESKAAKQIQSSEDIDSASAEEPKVVKHIQSSEDIDSASTEEPKVAQHIQYSEDIDNASAEEPKVAKHIQSSEEISSTSDEESRTAKHIQSSKEINSASAEESSETKRTFKYRIFGEGDSKDHPLFRFLAKFPLKQSPAPHTRPRPVKAILYAYAPGWKTGHEASGDSTLPKVGSFDADSLKWMTYMKFNNIQFELKPAFEPSMSPSGKLPFLALSNGSFVTSDGFEAWVQENKDQTAVAELDLHESAEAVAFITLAESKIHAALLYTLWFEPAHFYSTTRQHYFGHYKWLLTVLLSYLARSEIAHSMLLTRTQIDRELIFEEAASAIDALAVQLGDKNEYFFGKSKPSGLDAVVFSYLHVILTLPRIRNADDTGRSGELATIVRKHENLYKYSQNIWKKWFTV